MVLDKIYISVFLDLDLIFKTLNYEIIEYSHIKIKDPYIILKSNKYYKRNIWKSKSPRIYNYLESKHGKNVPHIR